MDSTPLTCASGARNREAIPRRVHISPASWPTNSPPVSVVRTSGHLPHAGDRHRGAPHLDRDERAGLAAQTLEVLVVAAPLGDVKTTRIARATRHSDRTEKDQLPMTTATDTSWRCATRTSERAVCTMRNRARDAESTRGIAIPYAQHMASRPPAGIAWRVTGRAVKR